MLGLAPAHFCFFFNDTATTEIYTLSLHDALPISWIAGNRAVRRVGRFAFGSAAGHPRARDRKSTRLNSSHVRISYAVFCLKKKKGTPRVSLTTGASATPENAEGQVCAQSRAARLV